MSYYEYLRNFHDISLRDYELLTCSLKNRAYKKNDMIVVPGQVQRELYFVKSGVQMSFSDERDKTHVVAFTYAPGLCVIPGSFSFQQPSKYFLNCITDSELQYLDYDTFLELMDSSRQLERLFRRMTEHFLSGMIDRHTELHSMTIEERYKAFCKRSSHLVQLVPHKYIASYLGIDATNFSKLFNKVRF